MIEIPSLASSTVAVGSEDLPSIGIGSFARVLRAAQLFDSNAIPGAVVVLPAGVALLERFRGLVESAYGAAGLQPYEYPAVVPDEVFAGTRAILPLDDRLLYVGTKSEIWHGLPPRVLSPTGEATIYSHWASLIRRRQDLPIAMYRNARYYRPTSRSGAGLFRAVESHDVYELHCAYAAAEEKTAARLRFAEMLRALVARFRLPALWTVRPPWTNHAAVADHVCAADVPIPSGETLQVAAVYDQGTIFSRAYGIVFRESGTSHYAEQLAGFCSRRLLLAHLYLGLQSDGTFLVHPDIVADQVVVLWQGERDGALADGPLRVRYESVTKEDIRRRCAAALRAGVPVVVMVQPKRSPSDRLKVIVRCNAAAGETVLFVSDLREATGAVSRMVEEVGDAYDLRVRARSGTAAIVDVDSLSARSRNGISLVPCDFAEHAVRHVERAAGAGEVLGFVRDERGNLLAAVSRRV